MKHEANTIRHYKAEPQSLKGARVLVVEDEVLIAMEIQSTLEDGGAEVVGPAYTLDEAAHIARTEEICVAVLDMRLGRHSVSPVARSLEQRGIPFLFYSGQPASDPIRSEWPDAAVISKPASSRQLLDAVRSLVRRTIAARSS